MTGSTVGFHRADEFGIPVMSGGAARDKGVPRESAEPRVQAIPRWIVDAVSPAVSDVQIGMDIDRRTPMTSAVRPRECWVTMIPLLAIALGKSAETARRALAAVRETSSAHRIMRIKWLGCSSLIFSAQVGNLLEVLLAAGVQSRAAKELVGAVTAVVVRGADALTVPEATITAGDEQILVEHANVSMGRDVPWQWYAAIAPRTAVQMLDDGTVPSLCTTHHDAAEVRIALLSHAHALSPSPFRPTRSVCVWLTLPVVCGAGPRHSAEQTDGSPTGWRTK